MGVNSIIPGGIIPALVRKPVEGGEQVGAASGPEKAGFGELLANLVRDVNELHGESGAIQQAFMRGDPVALHQVMIKAEEAGLATDLLLEVRNRLLSAYNELMRMPL